MLFVNNLQQNGSNDQKSRVLPGTCEGTAIAGMCMSEPGAGIASGQPVVYEQGIYSEKFTDSDDQIAQLVPFNRNGATFVPGTDVLGMSTKAVVSPDGASFKIDGTKMWITNGTVDGSSTGDVFLVYARTGPRRQDMSMFLVERASHHVLLSRKAERASLCFTSATRINLNLSKSSRRGL